MSNLQAYSGRSLVMYNLRCLIEVCITTNANSRARIVPDSHMLPCPKKAMRCPVSLNLANVMFPDCCTCTACFTAYGTKFLLHRLNCPILEYIYLPSQLNYKPPSNLSVLTISTDDLRHSCYHGRCSYCILHFSRRLC
jgi:hypothetical protein